MPLSNLFTNLIQPPAGQDTAGIDSKLIVAWEKAGATFRWRWHDDAGVPQFAAERPKGVTAWPSFDVRSMPLPAAQPLPIPTVPFALYAAGRPQAGFLAQLPGRSQAVALILDGVP